MEIFILVAMLILVIVTIIYMCKDTQLQSEYMDEFLSELTDALCKRGSDNEQVRSIMENAPDEACREVGQVAIQLRKAYEDEMRRKW